MRPTQPTHSPAAVATSPADMRHTGHIVVGLLYQPLILWGPLVGAVAVAVAYYRRARYDALSARHE
ncbi:hypothetical protein ABZ438_30340 [Streptomyces sp. NPDC005786]|uniref:hypothetical protein n=1 Tax=Streptomyces sp. NPDC005786 TaxID=3154891 RepID=UPI0033D7F157